MKNKALHKTAPDTHILTIVGLMVLALILILLYNGQRGRQTKDMQYGFYIFYPAHLLLLAILYHLFIL